MDVSGFAYKVILVREAIRGTEITAETISVRTIVIRDTPIVYQTFMEAVYLQLNSKRDKNAGVKENVFCFSPKIRTRNNPAGDRA